MGRGMRMIGEEREGVGGLGDYDGKKAVSE